MKNERTKNQLLGFVLWRCPITFLATCLIASLGTVTHALADQLPRAPNGTFSIVVIPDTQQYRGDGTRLGPIARNTQEAVTNPIFQSQTDWIVANLQKQKIVFVSQVGDIVDKNVPQEWAVARQCMDKLNGKVPYGISVGNHDMVEPTGDSSLFQEFFPASRFENCDWYGGCFLDSDGKWPQLGNNANSYQLFAVGNMNFIVLHLECNAPDAALEWANSILEKHSSRRAMITTHMDIGPVTKPNPEQPAKIRVGRMTWKKCHGQNGNSSQQMWEKCFSKHANLFLICCGDQSQSQAAYQSVRGLNGNLVHEILSDYVTHGLRVMRFIPAQDLIEVRTWNTVTKKPCLSTEKIPKRSEHQFVLNYEMNKIE